MEGNRKGKIAKELHRIAALIFFLLFPSPPLHFFLSSPELIFFRPSSSC